MKTPILKIIYKFSNGENIDRLEVKFTEIKEFSEIREKDVIFVKPKINFENDTLLEYFNVKKEGYIIPKNRIINHEIILR